MTDHLLSGSALAETLDQSAPAGIEISAGRPEAAYAELHDQDGITAGVWAMTPGSATDVEQDEICVIFDGAGRLDFEDGTTVPLHPGVVIRLCAGERVAWTVRETVRKVYVAWER